MDQLLEDLAEFGLKSNEARVYVEVLRLGLTNVGPVVEKTKLHRQIVYESLATLIDRQLVTCVIRNNRKHFQAAPLSSLKRILQRKREALDSLLPELHKLSNSGKDILDVRVMHGRDCFFQNLEELTEAAAKDDRIMRIIGGAQDKDFYAKLGRRYSSYVSLLEKHRVRKYLIAPESGSSEFKKKFVEEKGNVLKTLAVGLTSPTYTRITSSMVSIEIYDSDVTVIQLISKSTALGYREHFDIMWQAAKPYRIPR